jgi:hypothetical protein
MSERVSEVAMMIELKVEGTTWASCVACVESATAALPVDHS